jgi:hypothetical protein
MIHMAQANDHAPNPSSFSDALTEDYYAKKNAKRKKLGRARQKQVDWLRKKGKGNKRAEALAQKLEACRRKQRCKSAACPECAHAAQRLFAKVTQDYLKNKGSVGSVTVVPADGVADRGGLSVNETERLIRRNKDRFRRASVTSFIGVVDLSMNESKVKGHRPFWCQHIHGFAHTTDLKSMRRDLKKGFPKTPDIRRPVIIVEWDGGAAALRYPMKLPTKRRISIKSGSRFDKKSGKQRKCRDTDHQPLRSKDKLELLVHLDRVGIAGRLFLKGVQFLNLKDRGPTLADRQSKKRDR